MALTPRKAKRAAKKAAKKATKQVAKHPWALAGACALLVAAVLACYWIYREVGATLVSAGSPEPRYQRWIDTYSDESFSAVVDRLLDIVDELGPQLEPAVRARFTALWLRGCRYEWMFWDAAWTGQRWPV